jgi:hypothetical protein
MFDIKNASDEHEYLISLDKIRGYVDDYKLFAFYIGRDFKLRESIHSPLREDKNPSWAVFKSRNGGLMYKDFATNDSGDIVKLVAKLHHASYKEALAIIDRDFNLNLGGNVTVTHKIQGFVTNNSIDTVEELPAGVQIGIKIQAFKDTDVKYWNQYGITTECLKKYNVFSISKLFINGNGVSFYKKDNPMYAYVFKKDNELTYKIYRPFDTRYKWTSNVDKSVLQGWDQMPSSGDVLIITKSLKDVMVLNQMGYASISMQSEQSDIKAQVVNQLRARFKNILILQDFDYAGVCGVNKIRKKYGFIPFFIQSFKTRSNGLKDISDYVASKGFEAGKKLISELLNNLNGWR